MQSMLLVLDYPGSRTFSDYHIYEPAPSGYGVPLCGGAVPYQNDGRSGIYLLGYDYTAYGVDAVGHMGSRYSSPALSRDYHWGYVTNWLFYGGDVDQPSSNPGIFLDYNRSRDAGSGDIAFGSRLSEVP